MRIWREKLSQALGNNGQIIVDIIPEVELIIGKQDPVPTLGANEAQNRFNLIIGQTPDRVRKLSRLIQEKTRGNPSRNLISRGLFGSRIRFNDINMDRRTIAASCF